MKSPLWLLLLALAGAIVFAATRSTERTPLSPEPSAESPATVTRVPARLTAAESRPAENVAANAERREALPTSGKTRDARLLVRVVRKHDESPVPGARVVLRKDRSSRAVYLEGNTGSLEGAPLTDADGIARFTAPPEVELFLHAYAFEQALETDSVELAPFTPNEERELIVRLPTVTRATITGILRDEAGDPVVGRKIGIARLARAPGAVFTAQTRLEQEVATDATGRFTLADVGSGEWKIGPVPAPAIVPTARYVEIAPGTLDHHVDLTLIAGHSIEGVVLDPSGAPVAGAYVEAERAVSGDRFPVTKTAASGRYLLDCLPPGDYIVVASAYDGLLAPSRPKRVASDSRGIDLTLRAGGAIVGRLADNGGAALWLHHSYDTEFERRATAWGVSGFRFEALEPGGYSLTATSGRLVAHLPDVRVRPEQETHVELTLRPGGRIEVVLPEGLERAVCIVEQDGRRVLRIELGSGEGISPLPPGETSLSIFSRVPVNSTYSFDKAEGALDVNVVAEQTVVADFSR